MIQRGLRLVFFSLNGRRGRCREKRSGRWGRPLRWGAGTAKRARHSTRQRPQRHRHSTPISVYPHPSMPLRCRLFHHALVLPTLLHPAHRTLPTSGSRAARDGADGSIDHPTHTTRSRAAMPYVAYRVVVPCVRACVSVCFRVGVRETPGMAGIPWRFFADPAARDDRVGLGVVGWCPDRTANDNYAAPSLPCPRCLRLHGSVVARVLVLLHYYSMSNHFFMGRRESWIVISSACTATVPAEAEAMYYTL